MKKQADSGATEGWIQAIRQASASARKNEQARKRAASAGIAGVENASLGMDGRVPLLLDLMDSGVVTQGEFIETIRRWSAVPAEAQQRDGSEIRAPGHQVPARDRPGRKDRREGP